MAEVNRVIVWALQHKLKPHALLFASTNVYAPWVFRTREQARKKAKECAGHRLYVRPVRIKLTVEYEVDAGA